FGTRTLGMAYVELDVGRGTSPRIAAFYREVLDAPARIEGTAAVVTAGAGQSLRFRETDEPIAPYDGHHIQIYIADFSGPYERLRARGLVSRETDEHEYRFIRIVDDRGTRQFMADHGGASLHH